MTYPTPRRGAAEFWRDSLFVVRAQRSSLHYPDVKMDYWLQNLQDKLRRGIKDMSYKLFSNTFSGLVGGVVIANWPSTFRQIILTNLP